MSPQVRLLRYIFLQQFVRSFPAQVIGNGSLGCFNFRRNCFRWIGHGWDLASKEALAKTR